MKFSAVSFLVFFGVLLSAEGQRETLDKEEIGPLTLEEFEISEFSSYLAQYKGDEDEPAITNKTLIAEGKGFSIPAFFTCRRRWGCSRLMCGYCCGNRRA